jgi:hypothetical protein
MMDIPPIDADALLGELWAWEARYRAAYPQLNAAEIRRIWYVLTQLGGHRAQEYQKAAGQAPDQDDQFIEPLRG